MSFVWVIMLCVILISFIIINVFIQNVVALLSLTFFDTSVKNLQNSCFLFERPFYLRGTFVSNHLGATSLSITTASITTVSIMTLYITTVSITTLSIMTITIINIIVPSFPHLVRMTQSERPKVLLCHFAVCHYAVCHYAECCRSRQ